MKEEKTEADKSLQTKTWNKNSVWHIYVTNDRDQQSILESFTIKKLEQRKALKSRTSFNEED